LKKAAVRKHWKWWGEKYKGGESSPTLPFPHDLQAGMDVAGYYSPCQLREGDGRGRQNNKLIEKGCREKILVTGGGNKNNRQTHHCRLLCDIFEQGTVAASCIPLVD
jgi:hypothetical protein